MYYITGEKINLNDIVYLNDEKIYGKVIDVIFDEEKKCLWNVDNFGLMIECSLFGFLFLSENFIGDIIFIDRYIE